MKPCASSSGGTYGLPSTLSSRPRSASAGCLRLQTPAIDRNASARHHWVMTPYRGSSAIPPQETAVAACRRASLTARSVAMPASTSSPAGISCDQRARTAATTLRRSGIRPRGSPETRRSASGGAWCPSHPSFVHRFRRFPRRRFCLPGINRQILMTLDISPESGGGARVTCRPAEIHAERQLVDPVLSDCRSQPASRFSEVATAGP